jgi:hypothetical protein
MNNTVLKWRNIQDEQPEVFTEIILAVNGDTGVEFKPCGLTGGYTKEDLDELKSDNMEIYWTYTSEITPF